MKSRSNGCPWFAGLKWRKLKSHLTKKLMAVIPAVVSMAGMVWLPGIAAQAAATDSTIYDANPDHLWNRLNETLFLRTTSDGKTFGLDELDILYWASTTNLLAGPSHDRAIAVLDEFINSHGDKLIRDPFKRALLQRDLWELFDWSAKPVAGGEPRRALRELQSRLVVVIHRLALTTNEVASLPDNYALAEANRSLTNLPRGLFQTNGDWVNVRDSDDLLTAPTHVSQFNGHSVFNVLFRVPAGRTAALAYLDKLHAFTTNHPCAGLRLNNGISKLNGKLPQFPAGTEWALVRRLCLIDDDELIQLTPITESIQLRHYQRIEQMYQGSHDAQRFFEFDLDHRHAGALRAIGRNERGFALVHFMGMGIDPFEKSDRNKEPPDSTKIESVPLENCFQCHGGAGIGSVQSYTRALSFFPFGGISRTFGTLTDSEMNEELEWTLLWKYRQYDWGLWQGLSGR
jgi:hypothetical protein